MPGSSGPEARRGSIGARRNPESEAAILDAAEAILTEAGLGGFSIEAVARRARAGKPTIYRWWPNRTALLLDVYHRQKGLAVYADTGSIEGDVAYFLDHLFNHWRSSGAGQVFRFVVAEAQRDEAAAEALSLYAAERRQQTGAIFARAKARGELAADVEPELAAEMLAAIAWERLLTGRIDLAPGDVAAIARHLVRGLLAR